MHLTMDAVLDIFPSICNPQKKGREHENFTYSDVYFIEKYIIVGLPRVRAGSAFRGALGNLGVRGPQPLASHQTHSPKTPLQPSYLYPSSLYNLELQILPFFLIFFISPTTYFNTTAEVR